jgi:hypothetical protein
MAGETNNRSRKGKSVVHASRSCVRNGNCGILKGLQVNEKNIYIVGNIERKLKEGRRTGDRRREGDKKEQRTS